MSNGRIRVSWILTVVAVFVLAVTCTTEREESARTDADSRSEAVGDNDQQSIDADESVDAAVPDLALPLCECDVPDETECRECHEEDDLCLDGWKISSCVRYFEAKQACMDTFDCFSSGPPGACQFESGRFTCIHCDYPRSTCTEDADCASEFPDCEAADLNCHRSSWTCSLNPWGEKRWLDTIEYGWCECDQ